MHRQLCLCALQTEERLDSYMSAANNASIYSTSLQQRLTLVTSVSFDALTSLNDAILNATLNATEYLKSRAEVMWLAIQSRADTVRYADDIVDAMRQRVTSAIESVVRSETLRESVNETLNDLVPVDISAELQDIGNVDDVMIIFIYHNHGSSNNKCNLNINKYTDITNYYD